MLITKPASVENYNPLRMGRFAVRNVNTKNMPDNSTVDDFWTKVDGAGAYLSADITADVFSTIVDITGAGGYLSSVIGPTSTAEGEETIVRLTVDGTLTNITLGSPGSLHRALLGAALSSLYASGEVAMEWGEGPGVAPTYNLLTAYGQVVSGEELHPQPVPMAMSLGLGLLRFDSQLKVELAHSANITSAGANEASRGVLYAID